MLHLMPETTRNPCKRAAFAPIVFLIYLERKKRTCDIVSDVVRLALSDPNFPDLQSESELLAYFLQRHRRQHFVIWRSTQVARFSICLVCAMDRQRALPCGNPDHPPPVETLLRVEKPPRAAIVAFVIGAIVKVLGGLAKAEAPILAVPERPLVRTAPSALA